jgi:hypothetical protein
MDDNMAYIWLMPEVWMAVDGRRLPSLHVQRRSGPPRACLFGVGLVTAHNKLACQA